MLRWPRVTKSLKLKRWVRIGWSKTATQEEYFGEGRFVPYQKALWDLFQKPQSGSAAKVV